MRRQPSPKAHNLSTHSNLTLALLNPLFPPFPPPSPLAPFPPHRTISIVKYVRVHSTNTRCFSVTYVTQDGIWTAFSHPLLLSHMESGDVPYASRATSYPRQQHSTVASFPPFSISILIKILQKNDSLSLICGSGLPITIYLKKQKKTMYFQTLPSEFRTMDYS